MNTCLWFRLNASKLCTLIPNTVHVRSQGYAPCLACEADTYSADTGAATCAKCPANSFSGVGSRVCTCFDGYTATSVDGDCIAPTKSQTPKEVEYATSSHVVLVVLGLHPISPEDFTQHKQELFRASLARVASVVPDAVHIDLLQRVSSTRRIYRAGNVSERGDSSRQGGRRAGVVPSRIRVASSVGAKGADTAYSILRTLSIEAINAELAKVRYKTTKP